MIKIDTSAFERAARDLGRSIDQLPFAFSRTMNDAAKATRNSLIRETWPSAVKVRNRSFISWALRIKFSTKRNLEIEINDDNAQGRGHLGLHAYGGVKAAKGLQAIPGKFIRKNGRGVPKSMMPRALPNSFRKGDVILQRVKTSKRKGAPSKLRIMYVLKPSVTIKKDVPFRRDFERVFREEFMRAAPARIEQAFATMKRK